MNEYVVVQNEIFKKENGELVWVASFQFTEDAECVSISLNARQFVEELVEEFAENL